jgi:hypothetical protein
MTERQCGLAGDTRVETPEGAMMIRSVAGKSISAFTREPGGRVRFRRMLDVHCVEEKAPVVRITLATGASFRVAPYQVLYKKGMIEARADEVKAGDELVPAFHYADGYEYRDDSTQTQVKSHESIRVKSVDADGEASVFSLGVNQTGNFFVAAGVLCKAQGA